MFLKANNRRKNGKPHRYFSVVENRRVARDKVVQRQVLYLGEINDAQEAAWRKTLEVFDESYERFETLSLFPDDRPVPADAVEAVQVKLGEMELRRPRSFGDCWLVCEVWRELGLDVFWEERLGKEAGEVPWEKVLALLVANRVCDPGSEFRVHRYWFEQSAMDQLLQVTFAAAGKDRLYRCLDLLLAHKEALFKHLRRRWESLFCAQFEVLLYDLTSTYFEGLAERIPKAKHGYSRDGRPDCLQLVIALIITPDGLPLAYEVMPGNTSDRGTLPRFIRAIEERYGKAQRVWVMDRGIPREEDLKEMRARGVQYLVGTPKGLLSEVEQSFLSLPWTKVKDDLQVKLLPRTNEVLVLARSEARKEKERAIRRRKLRKYFRGLRALRQQAPSRDKLLQRLGVLKHKAGRAAALVKIEVPKAGEPVTPQTFRFALRVDRFKAAEARDGQYLLRTSLCGEEPQVLWTLYIQLVEIEAAFRCLKSDLRLRPIYHQLEARVEAHIFVTFLAYCVRTTLRQWLRPHAPGLTPQAVLEKLSAIQMLDVWLPTTDGRYLVMPRYTQPEQDQKILLHLLKLKLPTQPPPRIKAGSRPIPVNSEPKM